MLLVSLLMLPLLGRAQMDLFKKYVEMKGVTSTYISKAMLEMNNGLLTGDLTIGKLSGQLTSVQMLSARDAESRKLLRKDLDNMVKSSKYELLMRQQSLTTCSAFYMNKKGDKVKELIMIIDGPAQLKFIYLEGDMTMRDIQNIMMLQSHNYGGNGDELNNLLGDLGNYTVVKAYNWEEFREGMEKLRKSLGKQFRD